MLPAVPLRGIGAGQAAREVRVIAHRGRQVGAVDAMHAPVLEDSVGLGQKPDGISLAEVLDEVFVEYDLRAAVR